MKRIQLLTLTIALALFVALVPEIAAFTNGSVEFTSAEKENYRVSLIPSDDDSEGEDIVCVVCYDADGNATDVDYFNIETSTEPTEYINECDTIKGFSENPADSVKLGDPTSYPSEGENSAQGLAQCEAAMAPEIPEPVPGCDQFLAITDSAVVGSFVSTTNAYWAPGEVSPDVVIEAGKTAWVLGVDESGEYYKIVWACSTLWVPVETMGPNYDDVWNGTPLPTEVVE